MGRIPDQVIQQVRDRADIAEVVGSYVALKPRGRDLWGCCPFHQEKSPSFKVNPERQAYYCFGCHKSGNVFSFVMDRENIDFASSVRLLAGRYGIAVPEEEETPEQARTKAEKEAVFQVLERIAQWYQWNLGQPQGQPARDYLAGRGIEPEWVQQFGLGYSPDAWDAAIGWARQQGIPAEILEKAGLVVPRENTSPPQFHDRFRGRLMFPIKDELGRVVGFSARTLKADEKMGKYINSPETPVFHKNRILYGLHFARQTFKKHGYALVCEGQLDVMACFRAGQDNAVCAQGTAFTENHAALLKRFVDTVHFCFDADAAGQKAAVRSIQLATAAGFRIKVVQLPPGDDPDSLLKRAGAEAVRTAFAQSRDALDYLIATAQASHDAGTVLGKDSIVNEVLPVIALNSSPVIQAAQCQQLAAAVGLREETILEALERHKAAQARQGPFQKTVYGDNGQPVVLSQRPGRPAAPPPPDFSAKLGGRRRPAELALHPKEVRAAQILLDLALNFPALAPALLAAVNPEWLGDAPVEKALGLTLNELQHGDLEEARRLLVAEQELISDPLVGKVMAASEFLYLAEEIARPAPKPEEEQESEEVQWRRKREADEKVAAEQRRRQELLDRAVSDCGNIIHLGYIDRAVQRLNDELEKSLDDDRQAVLFKEINELKREKRQLAKGASSQELPAAPSPANPDPAAASISDDDYSNYN